MGLFESPVHDAGQRARLYWFKDGLPTAAFGLTMVLFAAAFFHFPPFSLMASSVVNAGLCALLILAQLLQEAATESFKTRITYPRAGYVRPDAPPPRLTILNLSADDVELHRQEQQHRLHALRKKTMMLWLPLTLLVQFGLSEIGSRWAFTAAGILVAAALWCTRELYPSSPFLLLGFPLLGLGMTMFAVPYLEQGNRFLGLVAGGGFLLMLDGTISLIRFINRRPLTKVTQA